MNITCSFQTDATVVENEFIDHYMAQANGEYVKVYLYLLRHRQEEPELGQIADALNHTEADVKRALLYWEKCGILKLETDQTAPVSRESAAAAEQTGGGRTGRTSRKAPAEEQLRQQSGQQETPVCRAASSRQQKRPPYSQDQVNRLQGDGEFSQLLYIAQRYLNKIFTQRDLEVFAYLYDGLHMTSELLEYLVEYCVQGGHNSLRYIETVALSWHEKGFSTVEEAKTYASAFTKDSFSVMRAFGLNDRKPGDSEKEMIGRWFHTYGFTRDVVLEACNRTLEATHNPSFKYADKILSEWKKAGVKSLRDISELDEKRRSQGRAKTAPDKKAANQFHNFEQRNTDYDSMVMDQVKSWIGQPGGQ